MASAEDRNDRLTSMLAAARDEIVALRAEVEKLCTPVSTYGLYLCTNKPNTSNPDDWAKIAGKKGERIVYIKPIFATPEAKAKDVERIVTTGQYL